MRFEGGQFRTVYVGRSGIGASRGVACTPDHVVIVSGAQQGLDLIARLVVRPGDRRGSKTPATAARSTHFATRRRARAGTGRRRRAGSGAGRRRCPRPVAVYLTPAHQIAPHARAIGREAAAASSPLSGGVALERWMAALLGPALDLRSEIPLSSKISGRRRELEHQGCERRERGR